MKAGGFAANLGGPWIWILLLGMFAFQEAAHAETLLTPRVEARAEYDDNIRFTLEDPTDDLVLSLRPSLVSSHRTERLQIDTTAAVRALRHLEESDLDREELTLDSALRYGLNERVSLQGNASYRQDSALESELQETGLITEQVDRVRLSGGGGITFSLTELQELGSSFSLSRTTYDIERYLDYDTAYAALTWTRSFRNQRDSVTVQPYWSSNSSNVSDVDTYGLMLGWNRMLTENWSLRAFLGARRTRVEYTQVEQERGVPFHVDTRAVTREEASWGGLADVSLGWSGETWMFDASYNRDLSYSSGGEPIERDRLVLSVQKNVDTRFSVQCTGSALRSQYERASAREGTELLSLSPSLSYRLTETHRLSAGFRYSHFQSEDAVESGRDRKQLWVSLDCTFPRLW